MFNSNNKPQVKNVDKHSRTNKIRNVFVIRKGNSTRDSNQTNQNSNENFNNNVYGLERQTSINSLNESEVVARDNSLNNRQIYNSKHASSNGFQLYNKNSFEPYSQNGNFKTPRQNPADNLNKIEKHPVKINVRLFKYFLINFY